MLPLFAAADAAPAHHQPLERLLRNGDRDDTGSEVKCLLDDSPKCQIVIHMLCQTGPAETHTLRVCTVLNSVFFGWSLAAMTLESSMQGPPLTHLPAVMTHTEAAVAVSVCVRVCPSTEPSHAEEWTEWWHTLAASCHDLIHSERDRKRATENGKMRAAKMRRRCACVCACVCGGHRNFTQNYTMTSLCDVVTNWSDGNICAGVISLWLKIKTLYKVSY